MKTARILRDTLLAAAFALLLAHPAAAQQPATELPRAAQALAGALGDDLLASGAAAREGLRDVAFPGVLGDVQGALRDRLLARLLKDGLRRTAEREQVEAQLATYFRKDGFEKGLYDPASLKALGGAFKDNEGFVGARVYHVAGADGLQLYAQAELWNGRTMLQLWSGTTSCFVPVASAFTSQDKALLDGLLARSDLLAEDRARLQAQRDRVVAAEEAGAKAAADAKAKAEADKAKAEQEVAQQKAAAQQAEAAESARTRDLLTTAALVVLGLVALVVIGRVLLSRGQLARAERRATQADARVGARMALRDLRAEGSRRAHGLADRLGQAPGAARAQVDGLADRVRRAARAFENAPDPPASRPVAERDDALAAALQRLQRHDEGTLEVLAELERAADGLLTAAAGGAVPEGPLAQANGLADRVAGRLGERADLVRGMG